MQNNYMTTEYIANAFVNYTKLNLTFMGIANNDYESMFENNKVFTPGDNISAIIPSYPRVLTGLDLTEYGNQGYSTQVYNITLEQDGLCNVLRSMDNYTEAFKVDKSKTWEQFILPTHKAISKSIEYYIINKLRKSVTHCPISSIQYKLMLRNWIAKSTTASQTPNNPTFLNYVLSHKAYVERMNYLHNPCLVTSPSGANYFRQSILPLYTTSMVEKIAKDAYLGQYGGFETLQSPELSGNGAVSNQVNRYSVSGPTSVISLADKKVLNASIVVSQMVFSRTNSFNLSWIKVTTDKGVKPTMWEEGESLCLYFGQQSGPQTLPLNNCIGLTNQISQLRATNFVPLLFMEKREPIPAGVDAASSTEWWIPISQSSNQNIIGNNAATWKTDYLGPALSLPITSPKKADFNKFMLECNAVGYNFEYGRIGSFDQDTIGIATDDIIVSGAKPVSKGDLVTKPLQIGLLDSYYYEDAGNQVVSEWGYGVSEQGLTVINPPIGKVASAETTIAKDKETGRYSFRATYQGNSVQSTNYYRIDTLVGVGVVPIYTFAFPMPIGIAI